MLIALDADTQFEPETIAKLARWFADPKLGAVAGDARVGNRVNLVTRWQAVEYITAQNLERRALAGFDAMTVVPGAVGAWRRAALDAVGGYPEDTLAEDQDLTIAIQRAGWRVTYDPRAVAWTEAPESFRALAKQRYRWAFGTLQCLWKHRAILRTGKPAGLARIGLPQAWLFQILFAAISPLIDLALVLSIIGTAVRVGQHGWAQTQTDVFQMAAYWTVFTMVDVLCGWLAYRLDGNRVRYPAHLLVAQRLVYRQIMYWVVIRAIASAIGGWIVGWGKLERTGNVGRNLPILPIFDGEGTAGRKPGGGGAGGPCPPPPLARWSPPQASLGRIESAQCHPDDQTRRVVLQRHGAAMQMRHRAGQRQAQPCAALRPRGVQPSEPLQRLVPAVFGNTGAVIRDDQYRTRLDPDDDFARTIFQRIVDEVGDRLAQQFAMDPCDQRLRPLGADGHAAILGQRLEHVGHIADHRAQIGLDKGVAAQPRLGPADAQRGVEHGEQPVAFLQRAADGDPCILVPALRQRAVQRRAQPGQRRAQIVGQSIGRDLQFGHQQRDPVEHRVDRFASASKASSPPLGATRRDRSPAATAWAVATVSSSRRSIIRAAIQAASAARTIAAAMPTAIASSIANATRSSLSTTWPASIREPSGRRDAITRIRSGCEWPMRKISIVAAPGWGRWGPFGDVARHEAALRIGQQDDRQRQAVGVQPPVDCRAHRLCPPASHMPDNSSCRSLAASSACAAISLRVRWRTVTTIAPAPISWSAKTSSANRSVVERRTAGAISRPQLITRAAHRMQERAGKAFVDLLAQPADMHVGDVGVGVEMEIPHALQQHGAGHDLVDMLEQIFEQPVFARLQVDRLARAPHAVGEQVHLQIVAHQLGLRRIARRSAAPDQQADPRQQLGEDEGLGQVIVRAGGQSRHPVLRRGKRRQDQHRRFDPRRADRGQHRHAVHARQHPIENDAVVSAVGGMERPSRPLAAWSIRKPSSRNPLAM